MLAEPSRVGHLSYESLDQTTINITGAYWYGQFCPREIELHRWCGFGSIPTHVPRIPGSHRIPLCIKMNEHYTAV